MYNLNCIIVIVFNCTRAYAQSYTLIYIYIYIYLFIYLIAKRLENYLIDGLISSGGYIFK